MFKEPRTKHPLRCFCARAPMLAMFGLDSQNRLYIHVRVYKQKRVYADLVFTSGKVELMCRQCFRWHNIIIRESLVAELEETRRPAVLDGEVRA